MVALDAGPKASRARRRLRAPEGQFGGLGCRRVPTCRAGRTRGGHRQGRPRDGAPPRGATSTQAVGRGTSAVARVWPRAEATSRRSPGGGGMPLSVRPAFPAPLRRGLTARTRFGRSSFVVPGSRAAQGNRRMKPEYPPRPTRRPQATGARGPDGAQGCGQDRWTSEALGWPACRCPSPSPPPRKPPAAAPAPVDVRYLALLAFAFLLGVTWSFRGTSQKYARPDLEGVRHDAAATGPDRRGQGGAGGCR